MQTNKHQFSIFEYNNKTNNSAATKAVTDCIKLLNVLGYQDHVLIFKTESKRGLKFYSVIFIKLCRFLFKIKANSLVSIQYPMLNNVFKYFIRIARLKKIKFFCVVHDIESLRAGGVIAADVKRECDNLNYYDCIIVHNDAMAKWLENNGVKTPLIALTVFDYLTDMPGKEPASPFSKTIVYAGNLGKSKFVYDLKNLGEWNFNLYGSNFKKAAIADTVKWQGEFSPDEVVKQLRGDFGLIWDGESINELDATLGNYLKYNNPHKFSLYLAAGLPVIAPSDSAIADVINTYNVGILIDRLADLMEINISNEQYQVLRQNTIMLQKQVSSGYFFKTAVNAVEKQLVN